MSHTKTGLFGVLVLVMLLLAACSSGLVKDSYTAAGNINDPDEMTKTGTFRPDEDLNVIVTLNGHNRKVPVYAVFTAPAGAGTYTTDTLEVGETAGKVLLGLDWEMAGSLPWATGQWTVEIFIDGEREDTVTFTVESAAGTPTATPAAAG